jgi:hypothetical protein
MPENKNTRDFHAQSTLNPGTRLEALHSPTTGKTRTPPYKRLTHQQRTALVEKLIDFLKSM